MSFNIEIEMKNTYVLMCVFVYWDIAITSASVYNVTQQDAMAHDWHNGPKRERAVKEIECWTCNKDGMPYKTI